MARRRYPLPPGWWGRREFARIVREETNELANKKLSLHLRAVRSGKKHHPDNINFWMSKLWRRDDEQSQV